VKVFAFNLTFCVFYIKIVGQYMWRCLFIGRRERSAIVLCWLLSVSFSQACADYAKENPLLLVLLILLGVAFVGVGGFILYLFLMGKKNAPAQEEPTEIKTETTEAPAEEAKSETTEAPAEEVKTEAHSTEESTSEPSAKPEEKAGDEPQA
jgi:cytoskeletal protein RodZ